MMLTEVTIKLTPEQRFLMTAANEEMLVFVDEITYFGGAKQIIFSGKAFNLDYEDLTVIKAISDRVGVNYEMNEISTCGDE